ncbi:ATP-binding protein [Streptomyces sp. NPDC050529]|uniref:ATP-binding protein n=1 Tax=unclassified Streptomyces TaxID=2593676 RepID=UPI002DD7F01C|nr:ATP-binding protein [Streptomyces sp. NBC_01022]WRZ83254.1 ATP-binding protein [Streptomyces sp. NBC_01022]
MTNRVTKPLPINPFGGETYRLTLPNTAVAAKLARDFVTSLLGVSRHHDLVEDAQVCVSEVVTNAHRHASTPLIRVHVAVNRKRVTVAVADDGPADPTLLRALCAEPEQERGRGLLLVESLALAWGANTAGELQPGRKVVWFTLGQPYPNSGRA